MKDNNLVFMEDDAVGKMDRPDTTIAAEIIDIVCDEYGIDKEILLNSQNRTSEILYQGESSCIYVVRIQVCRLEKSER